MKSSDWAQIIITDASIQNSIFDYMYARRKDLTVADLLPGTEHELSYSIYDLQYDETTRRPMFTSVEDLKTQCLDNINKDKKPYRRWWKRKTSEGIERCFSISDLYDFVVLTKENDTGIIIEYYVDHLGQNSLVPSATALLPNATPFLVSTREK